MLDTRLRQALDAPLAATGVRLSNLGVRPAWLTAGGLLVGVGACVAAGYGAWTTALVLWLVNRALDGLDGPVARASHSASELGGFLDLLADFTVYAGFVVGVGIAEASSRVACLVLLTAYYASGTAFLLVSGFVERRGVNRWRDERSLNFVGGLAEGAETIAAYVVFCLFPAHAETVAWVFAALVGVTAGQRVVWGVRVLRAPNPERRPDAKELR